MDARILFVISGAYGDLSLAMSFVYGQAFSSQTAIALPRKLYSVNRDSLPLQTFQYRSVKDILYAATDWEARVVFLLSGYGLPNEGLTSPLGLGRFVKSLRNEGCCVVTTDPFLGSATQLMKREIIGMLPPTSGRLHEFLWAYLARRVARNLNKASDALRDVVHLYPGSTDSIVNHSGVQRISFYNPALSKKDSARDDSVDRGNTMTVEDSNEKVWLFMIAWNDVNMQQRKWGASKFANQLAHIFEQTRNAGRRPVLLGPPSLLKNMKNLLSAAIGCELVSYCAYPEFARRSLDAEYVFSWNIFSCSAVSIRLVRKLPVIFFDRGHVAQFSPRIYKDGLRCYYGGWEPRRLDYREFSADVLSDIVVNQERAVDALLEYWKQSPTPGQVIDRLLQGSTVQSSKI